MKKLIALVVCLFFTLATYSQSTESFNRMSEYKYSGKSWGDVIITGNNVYTVTLNTSDHTMSIVRASDRSKLNFIQVITFVTKGDYYVFSGLLLGKDNSTHPVVGVITVDSVELNLGGLIWKFYNVKEVSKV